MSSSSKVVTPQNLLRPEILALNAYHVPPPSQVIKLDAMENPYPLPETLSAEIAQLVAHAAINRYPDAAAQGLKEQIRRVTGLADETGILLGNGSDEIIQILALALAKPGAVLLSVEPSFVMYRMIAAFAGMRYVGVPLAKDFSLDLTAILENIQREQPALVFLAYPNNPTGNLFNAAAIEQIIAATPGVVVVDEAYYAFASDSFISRLTHYDNLLVMRTFSKLGMAGLRVGFLAGAAAWLDQLEKLRLPYNVGVLPQLVASKLLQHHEVLLQQADRIKAERVRLKSLLDGLDGVHTYPSEANFILLKVAGAGRIFGELKQRGVLIKSLDGGHPALVDCLRVTVGTPLENDKFIEALKACL